MTNLNKRIKGIYEDIFEIEPSKEAILKISENIEHFIDTSMCMDIDIKIGILDYIKNIFSDKCINLKLATSDFEKKVEDVMVSHFESYCSESKILANLICEKIDEIDDDAEIMRIIGIILGEIQM